jgi:uncharacterized membrane protein YqiK
VIVFLAILGAIIAIAVLVAFMNRFYRKSTRDVALVRTGFGGQKVVLSAVASRCRSCTKSKRSTCAPTASKCGAPARSR